MNNPAGRSLAPCPALLLFLLASLVGAGCAGNSPEGRAGRSAAFNNLPAREQRLALAGQVRAGMSTEAVAIAWGRPTQVFQGKVGERRLLAWIYLRAAPAQPSGPDFATYPADYLAARFDYRSAFYRGDRFYNQPGTYESRFYPGAVFYPGPIGPGIGSPGYGYSPFGVPALGADPLLLDRQAIFENGRLVRAVESPRAR